MTALLGALFPVLAGRVDAALRIRGQQMQLDRLVRENARLRQKVASHERYRRAARARLSAAAREGGR